MLINSHPTISIITPVLNNVRFIKGCLSNVVDQNNNDIEHIVVDGGSTDGTLEIIREFSNSRSHIKYISESDSGQSEALNKGIKLSSAKAIGILNVDDYYESGTLSLITGKLRKTLNPSFIVGACNILNENGEILETYNPKNLSISKIIGTKKFPPNPSSYFYHKSLHDQYGLYDENEHNAMDLDFILKLLNARVPIIYVSEILGNFRLLPGTKTYQNIRSEQGVQNMSQILGSYKSFLSLTDIILLNLYRFQAFSERVKNFLT